jgi:hypothetical protein
MARGGRREGAGRKRGTLSKVSKSRLLAAEAQAKAQAAGVTPLEFLCSIYRDESQPQAVRIAAAEAAMPYMHPKLAMVATKVDAQVLVLSEEERARKQEEAHRQAMEAFDAAFGLVASEPPPAPPLIEPPVKPEEIEIEPEADPILATKQKNIGLTDEQREARLQTPNGQLVL